MARAPTTGAQAGNSPSAAPQAAQPAPVPSSGPNANPLDLFPQVAVASNWLLPILIKDIDT